MEAFNFQVSPKFSNVFCHSWDFRKWLIYILSHYLDRSFVNVLECFMFFSSSPVDGCLHPGVRRYLKIIQIIIIQIIQIIHKYFSSRRMFAPLREKISQEYTNNTNTNANTNTNTNTNNTERLATLTSVISQDIRYRRN